MKTTMTDFRIVGIEVKELDWSWGMVKDEAGIEVKHEDSDGSTDPAEQEDEAVTTPPEEPDDKEIAVKSEPVDTTEPAECTDPEVVEEKRGEKRKAKTPDGGESQFSYSPIVLFLR